MESPPMNMYKSPKSSMNFQRIYFLFNLVVIFSVISLSVLLFSCFISENPISPHPKTAHYIRKLLPQGWGFFTRDPREPALIMYRVNDDNSLCLITLPNSSQLNCYGFSRKSRRLHLEFLRLQNLIPQELWKRCHNKSLSFLEQLTPTGIKSNEEFLFLTAAKYVLLRYSKPTWLYLNSSLIFDDKKEFVIIEFSTK